MALASFFNKAALGASALMQGVSPESFAELMSPLGVTLRFSGSTVRAGEGRISLELLTNLLARLYPSLGFDPSCEESARFAEDLKAQARAINPKIDFIPPTAPFVVVGEVGSPKSGFCAYIGSNGWAAYFSTNSPRIVGTSSNPIGAAAAACFGAAAIFRHYFHAQLSVPAPAEEFALSLYSYRRSVEPEAERPTDVDIGELALAGVGAIGNATVWTLARTASSGIVHLVDPEIVEETNPQRYVLTIGDSVGQEKVSIAHGLLISSKLRPQKYRETWGEFISRRGWRIPLVAVALDSAEDRIAVQASLPKFILNAWTQANDLGISRHSFVTESACLACLYWPTKQHLNADELVKQAIRYDGNLMDIRNMLYFRTPLDDAMIDRVARCMGVERERISEFKGRPLDVFYRDGICGGRVLATAEARIEVPMAFQSAFAGVMLAGEVIKFAGNGYRLDTAEVTTKIDLLRPLGTHLSEPYRKRRDVKCICSDEAYVKRFREKYQTAPQVTPVLKVTTA
jgi:hypothetical protein